MYNKEKIIKMSIPEPNTGCWLWLGNYHKSTKRPRTKLKRKSVTAHKYSYIAFKGFPKEGLLICHTCDNIACVNPDHLYAGTNSDNQKDAFRRGGSINRARDEFGRFL